MCVLTPSYKTSWMFVHWVYSKVEHLYPIKVAVLASVYPPPPLQQHGRDRGLTFPMGQEWERWGGINLSRERACLGRKIYPLDRTYQLDIYPFQQMPHYWHIKDRCMYYPVCGIVHNKDSILSTEVWQKGFCYLSVDVAL